MKIKSQNNMKFRCVIYFFLIIRIFIKIYSNTPSHTPSHTQTLPRIVTCITKKLRYFNRFLLSRNRRRKQIRLSEQHSPSVQSYLQARRRLPKSRQMTAGSTGLPGVDFIVHRSPCRQNCLTSYSSYASFLSAPESQLARVSS